MLKVKRMATLYTWIPATYSFKVNIYLQAWVKAWVKAGVKVGPQPCRATIAEIAPRSITRASLLGLKSWKCIVVSLHVFSFIYRTS